MLNRPGGSQSPFFSCDAESHPGVNGPEKQTDPLPAVQEALNGKVVDWMEKVSEEQYDVSTT
jgi:hypothetical protein